MTDIHVLVEKQRNFFLSGVTLPLETRIENLKKLKSAILKYEEKLTEALYKDLHKSKFESYEAEIGIVLDEISHMLKHLPKYMRRERVSVPLTHVPATSYVYHEPYGVTLIMAPWNYPVQLALNPLVGAIAGGNCAVMKTSATVPATSAVLYEMLKETFPEEFVAVVEGKYKESRDLPDEKFDLIFFTGSVGIGKQIMERAAKHLTPVVLELGGKSPCIVDETADLAMAAKRIVWGKSLNAGQTCVAPDYLYVQSSVKDALIEELKKAIPALLTEDILKNEDFPHIITDHHVERLSNLIQTGKVVYGGRVDKENRSIEMTVVDEVTWDDPLMQEELFGPILPVVTYETREEMIETLNHKEKPLALYLFTKDKETEKMVMERVAFGGGCVNDTIMHIASNHIAFGGVGNSGMGAYHGKQSFLTFTHAKGVVKKPKLLDLPFRYPPYTDGKLKILKMFMK